ncbi:MAG TPA: diacylglycerol kinase [Anaerolineae bacterium]|nr:diacylglycerol kinase [Anaerolineae bacterium]HMR63817.1 diacylglycerol kinase [Anaerolineae bacterium]
MPNIPIHRLRRRFDLFRKVRVFFSGLKLAIWSDFSVAYKMVLSLIVLGTSFWLREWFDFLLILVVTGLLLVAEIFNTAIEEICDYIQPEYDPKIGAIKDIASTAVGISILIWVCTLLLEIWRIWQSLGQLFNA